jgi:hypothetical protein
VVNNIPGIRQTSLRNGDSGARPIISDRKNGGRVFSKYQLVGENWRRDSDAK